MKNKIIKTLTFFSLIIILTGCTITLKDEDKKIVTYDSKLICETCFSSCEIEEEELSVLKEKENLTEEDLIRKKVLEKKVKSCITDCDKKCNLAKKNQTGQSLTENILCRPTNEDVKYIYDIYGIDTEKIVSCENYKINEGKYEGIWTTIFVKPLSWLLLKFGSIINNYGISLILIGLLIRFIMMPLTKSTALQSENIKKAQPEISAIENKYKGKTDQDSIMKKSQETMVIYKKYNINPLSSCLFAFLQIPILFAFIEAINRTPAIFEETLFGLKLGMTPFVALSRGEWWYLIIVILLALATIYSFKLNKTTTPDNAKQMQIINKVFIVFIIFMSFTLSTAIGLYWITSSSFTIFQNLLVKRSENK